MTSLRNRLIISVFLLLAYVPPALRYWQQREHTAPRAFVQDAPANAIESVPYFETESIPSGPAAISVHVASLCEGADGRLCAAWYGGSHEGARDVRIFWS